MKNNATLSRAFTLVELLVVIVIIAVLAAIQLPALANTKSKVQRIHCSDNLKRVGVAFHTWASSHSDRMPMSTSSFEGGAAQAVGVKATGLTFASNMSPTCKGVFGIFTVMSNELTTPKILYCPSEYRANITQGMIFGDTVGTNAGFFNDNGISYFVGVDANEFFPGLFLTGDHNLGDASTPPIGINIYGESKSFVSLGTNVIWTVNSPGWADNQHQRQGNVALSDGSVQNFTTPTLRAALNKTGDASRFAGVFSLASGSLGVGINRLQFP